MAKAHRPNKPHTATMSVDASKDKQSSSLTFPLTAPYRPSITGDEGTGQNKDSTDEMLRSLKSMMTMLKVSNKYIVVICIHHFKRCPQSEVDGVKYNTSKLILHCINIDK